MIETEFQPDSDSAFAKLIAVDELYAAECSARADRLVLLADIDDSQVWESNGHASMKHWLVSNYGVSYHLAAEWLRVGHALRELPELREKFRSGALSWDKIRAATRLATPETDGEVAGDAVNASAAELGRRARRIRREQLDDAQRDRYLRWWWDDTSPVLHLEGRVPDDQGVVIAKALDVLTQDRLPDPRLPDADRIYEHYDARCADALYRMASQALGSESDADRATVVLHVDARDLAVGSGRGATPHGPGLLPETLLRFACDSRVQAAIEAEDGTTLGIGRVSRSIPPWLRRQITSRDNGCVFPGCERTRWVHIHHIEHWAHGGPTDLDNLATLCPFHHRLIHDDGWRIEGDPNQELHWIRPDGNPYTPKPPVWTPGYRRRMTEQAEAWLAFRVRGSTRDDTS